MKITSNYLFQLIHSLTRNEKGYFKKQVLAHSHDTLDVQYLKLFNAILDQPEYNEEKLLHKFRNEKFVTQFSVAKNYLSYLILKSLVQYHSGKNAESNLNRELDFSHILFIKGFYKECMSQLTKAKKIAYKYDKHDYTITIIKKEKQLIASLKNDDMIADLQRLLEEEHKVLHNLSIESELGVVYYNFLNEIHKSRMRSSVLEHEQLNELRNSIGVKKESEYQTFNARNYFYGIETIYNYLINDFEKSAFYGRKHRMLWEENTDRFNDENDDYLEIIYHYISACFQTKNFNEIQICLNQIKNFETNTNDKKQRKYFIYYTLQMRYYASLAHYNELEILMAEIETNAKEIADELYPAYKITLCINCAIIYFIFENYKLGLNWLNKYLNTLNKDIRKDAYSFARIFNLMIHYKLGNNDLLEHVIKNTYREIKGESSIFEYEKMILSFIKKIAKNNTRKNVIAHARNLQIELKNLQNNPIERDAMRYFNFIRWLESEIQQIAYRILAEKEIKG